MQRCQNKYKGQDGIMTLNKPLQQYTIILSSCNTNYDIMWLYLCEIIQKWFVKSKVPTQQVITLHVLLT